MTDIDRFLEDYNAEFSGDFQIKDVYKMIKKDHPELLESKETFVKISIFLPVKGQRVYFININELKARMFDALSKNTLSFDEFELCKNALYEYTKNISSVNQRDLIEPTLSKLHNLIIYE